MLIWPEEQGWPQEIGALAILDGRSLFDAEGGFRIEAVREAVGRRLHLVPRFRQVLYWPRTGLGWPVWADAQSFDITEHVRVTQCRPPATSDNSSSPARRSGAARSTGPGRCGRCGS